MSDVPVRLLRETLREAAATAPSAACLDADTLAMWSDGALSAADRAAAESHAAGCARCQAMLAAMALTAPPAPARHWWRAGSYRWLVPLAAAAAAVVLWVAVPRTPVAPRAVAERTPIATAAPARPETRADDAATVRLKPNTSERAIEPTPPPAVQRQAKSEARSAQPQAAAPNALRDVRAAAPSLPPTAPVRADAFASSAVSPPPPPAAGPTEPPPAPPAASGAVAPPAPLEEAVAVAPNANESVQLRRERAAALSQALAKPSGAAQDIVSPDRNVRWRLRNPGTIDRSTDGGLTWQTQPTGVATPLVSGTAPTPTICWVAGSAGIVLRSTDGVTWQRVGLSEALDLTAIRASDAMNATVTAADGRVFTTGDGGRTWRAR